MNITASPHRIHFEARKNTPKVDLTAESKNLETHLQTKGFNYYWNGGDLTMIGVGNNEIFVYLKTKKAVKKAFDALKDPQKPDSQQLFFNNVKVQLKVMGAPQPA